jgi:hypothetical protein
LSALRPARVPSQADSLVASCFSAQGCLPCSRDANHRRPPRPNSEGIPGEEQTPPHWDSIAVLTLITKSCHGFKAARQRNPIATRFFVRRRGGGTESSYSKRFPFAAFAPRLAAQAVGARAADQERT